MGMGAMDIYTMMDAVSRLLDFRVQESGQIQSFGQIF